MTDQKQSKIIIKGVTKDGKQFRPSDWAERMSGNLSTFRNHRIYYSPLLQPILKDGFKCIQVDPTLEQTNPELFDTILSFAKNNQLTICKDDDDTE